MNHSHLDQAREWAERMGKIEGLMPGHRAAAEVVQALPDEWIDAEKVREVISKVLANTIHGTVGRQVAEDYAALIGELIPAPPLPTLAELIEQGGDPRQYVGMQCEVEGEVKTMILLAREGLGSWLLASKLGYSWKMPRAITPLPDLPRLKWPGDGVEDAPVVDGEPALPRPEDVPAGEPWIVEHYGHRWVGTREEARDTIYTWALARFDGADYSMANDVDITLITRLVPEDKP